MSDVVKLNEAVKEYVKANKTLDENLNRIMQEKQKARQEQTERQNH